MNRYPVVTVDGTPAIGQVPVASATPFDNASNYRTITPRDLAAAVGTSDPTLSQYDLTVDYARTFLGEAFGPSNGALIAFAGGVPVLTNGDGDAVEYDAHDSPIVGGAVSAASAGPDADLFWLNRTFGKR